MSSTARLRLGLLLALALSVAGCGSDETDETVSTGSTTSTSATTTPAPAALRIVAHDRFGMILVDGAGFTLYRNAEETGTTIACTAACAVAWPPLLSSTTSAGDVPDVGTVTRPDGALQVTFQGRPLYRYAQDRQPGDTNGHSVGDIWLVVQPAPAPAASASPAPTAAPAAAATTTTRPVTAATTRPPATNAPATTAPTTTPATTPATTAPTTAPPTTPAPTTSPTYTVPTTPGGYCDYPPCDP